LSSQLCQLEEIPRFHDLPYFSRSFPSISTMTTIQGFNSHEMTAILATNVIHATMHLASTMATIHVLLQPGGHIVFNEVQNPGTLGEDGVGRGRGMDGWGMVGGKGGDDDVFWQTWIV